MSYELLNYRLGEYELHEGIGEGGMATVYKAYHPHFGDVALKILPDHMVHNPGMLQRFLREARAMNTLPHPNIVQFYDTGSVPNPIRPNSVIHYIAMEFINGGNFVDRISQSDKPSIDGILQMGIDIASALAFAHANGIIHRDIKPSNILFRRSDKPNGKESAVLADFGIAKANNIVSLTQTGGITGTVAYMAPELTTGEPASPKSDLYSLALVMYQGLTGYHPFISESTPAMLRSVQNGLVPPINTVAPEVPPLIADIIQNALAKHPSHRPYDASQFVYVLQQAKVGRRPSSPRIEVGGMIPIVPPPRQANALENLTPITQAPPPQGMPYQYNNPQAPIHESPPYTPPAYSPQVKPRRSSRMASNIPIGSILVIIGVIAFVVIGMMLLVG